MSKGKEILAVALNKAIVITALSLGLGFCLGSCSEKDNDRTTTAAYLLPQLKGHVIDRLELSSDEGTVRLSQKNNRWWLDKPMDFPADESVVDNFLRSILDAEIGKEVDADGNGLADLNVNRELGLTVLINYDSGKTLELILGKFDIPQNTNDALMMGVSAIARRYIRVIDGAKDNIYLVPMALADLATNNTLWSDISYVRIPSFKRIAFMVDGQISQSYSRQQMFGRLQSDLNDSMVNPSLAQCFEEFLASGQVYAIEDSTQKISANYPADKSHLVVEDFLGDTYRFEFGSPERPSSEEVERRERQASFMDHGRASESVPFYLTLTSSTTNFTNVLETALKEQNKTLAARFAGRVTHISYKQFACIRGFFTNDTAAKPESRQ